MKVLKKIIQVNVLVKYEKIKNVLLLGGNGQVGSEIKNINFSEKYNIISPNRSTLNLLNTNEIINFLDKNNFDFIINSSAYTDVDKAEVDKVNADTLNHKVPEILSVEAKKRDIGLIHISTDYVFGKDNCGPYKYDSQKNPCNFYGLTKSLGEMAVLKFCKNSTIIRIASVFSCYGDNFVKKIVNLVINQKEINVVNDQYISLTNANIFAQNIPQFIKINCINRDVQSEDLKIIHFTNFNYATWHKVSLVILDELKIIDKKINCIINPITSKKWKSNAVRPDDSRLVLDHDLLKKNDIINESWEISVRNTVRELYNNN
jgi:dTDP-4-dehydrorhamnose reductase